MLNKATDCQWQGDVFGTTAEFRDSRTERIKPAGFVRPAVPNDLPLGIPGDRLMVAARVKSNC